MEEIKARFAVSLFIYGGTLQEKYIDTYDIDDFNKLVKVLKAAMLQEIDVSIMNCGLYEEKDRPHYQSIDEVIAKIDKIWENEN